MIEVIGTNKCLHNGDYIVKLKTLKALIICFNKDVLKFLKDKLSNYNLNHVKGLKNRQSYTSYTNFRQV